MKYTKSKNKKTKYGDEDETLFRTPVETVFAGSETGLSVGQVDERMKYGWNNATVDTSGKSISDIIKENVFTYFNFIFLILAILLCLVGSFRNLTFLPIIIINTLIGIIQEIRSKKVLEKMNMLGAPKVTVIREGKKSVVLSEELVRDDIVIFKAGNQVPADACVVSGEVFVNESLLTGESDEISKKTGDALISGSYIVAGECRARLTAVGADSYISKLSLEAKEMKTEEQSEMMRALDKLLVIVGIALIPISILLFVQSFYFNGETFAKSITSMVAAVIGMIPEGLYLLTSVALAVSAIRLAGKNVLLHDMKSIETLARVDVMCVDKTGTITENTMEVKDLIPTDNYNRQALPELSKLVGDFAGAMSDDNITMSSLKKYFTEKTGAVPIKVTPFSSSVKYSGVTFPSGAYVLGAPEFVLRDDFSLYEKDIEEYASKGYRVLVFCIYKGEITGKPLTEKAVPLGYILLSNPIRKNAPATFEYFTKQGVEIKVISGDNPLTVVEAAKEAKIPNAEKYVDATTLKTRQDISRAMKEYTVFGRVTPEQKRLFVNVLKSQGRTVAMTGDGVNDVLALKDADCSIAMASGSDAAANASQLVLLNSDFSCMPSVVLEGRRVVNNIERSASLFLVKNIFSFFLALFSVISSITYPLEPSQVSLISMFTIGIPGFFFALQPNKDRIEGNFIQKVLLKALPAGLTDVIAVGSLVVFGDIFNVASTDISTAATMLLAIVGFMILYKISNPSNALQWGVWIGSILCFLICVIFLPELFAISGMSKECVMLLVVFSIATEPVLRYLTIGIENIQLLLKKWRRKRI